MKNNNSIFNRIKYKRKGFLFAVLIILPVFIAFFFIVPRSLFNAPFSTVVESSEGKLIGARIAADGQWRFPALDSVPVKYEKCLLNFEDRYFYYHPGINPVSVFRALFQNIKEKKIVSGGSTITMQVCRMARKQSKRSIKNKVIEMVWALKLELYFTKKEILNLYASHAPFGGNVVGLDAAAWRYFARPASELSWAESATLAVLPNAPSLIYPGRLEQKLKQKRKRLLKKLMTAGEIDSLTYKLSIVEPLPEKVNSLPLNAYHLVEKVAQEKKGQRIRSTIDYYLQEQIIELVSRHNKKLQANHIHNIAVVVSDVKTKEVRSYIGNVFDGKQFVHNNYVDVIQAKRSTGSILKPLLYCKMLDEGLITPQMLIPDIPTRFGGFTPLNFDQEFSGAVPASEALARSLNIPAVQMLRNFGVAPFYNFLQKTGMKSLSKNPDYYGLSLILGGAEISLWDLAGMYTSLVAILNNYNEKDGLYEAKPFSELTWTRNISTVHNEEEITGQPEVRAGSVYLTLKALLEVNRPESEAGWESFISARNIAWKTGTSFGFRDAWAVGMTRDYVVSVWVGNADGEGRQGLTGVTAAAPLLFDIFGLLPFSDWFEVPFDEMEKIKICAESGYRPGSNCELIKEVLVPKNSKVEVCPWHQKIHLNESGTHRVNADCFPVSKMIHKSWFILPPAMEYYFKQKNPSYSLLPPLLPGCSNDFENMEFIYPRQWNHVFIPTYLDGTPGQIIFELVHRQKNATVFWHLDEQYLGTTKSIHQFALNPEKGWHTINVTDNLGNRHLKRFQIVNEN